MENMKDIGKSESVLEAETTSMIANLKDAFGQWNKDVKCTDEAMITFYKGLAVPGDAVNEDYDSIEVYVLENQDDSKALSTAKALWIDNYYLVNKDKFVDYLADTKVLISSTDTTITEMNK